MAEFRHQSLVILLTLSAGCGLLTSCEGLFPPPLVIASYAPIETQNLPVGGWDIWVEFSREIPHAQAEAGIAFRENGVRLPCRFHWAGRRVTVVPDRGLAPGNDYELKVSGAVEDDRGVDLGEDFLVSFRTVAGDGRPEALNVEPAPGAVTSDLFQPVVVTFSRPVDRLSFASAWEIRPSVKVGFFWEPGDRTCKIIPLESLTPQTSYFWMVESSVVDSGGNPLGVQVHSWFQTGTPGDGPSVTRVVGTRLDPSSGLWEPVARDENRDELAGIEGTDGLRIDFDRPVQRAAVGSFLKIEPRWSYTIPPGEALTASVLLVPKERLTYGRVYLLTVLRGIPDGAGRAGKESRQMRIRVDGPRSVLPRLVSICFEPLTGKPTIVPGDHSLDFQALDLGAYTADTGPGTVRLSFVTADGADLDLPSVTRRFSVSASDFRTSVSVKTLVLEPKSPDGTQTVVVELMIRRGGPGVVVFRLDAGVSDTLGNMTDQDFSWPVLG